jgi:hypothetical protein
MSGKEEKGRTDKPQEAEARPVVAGPKPAVGGSEPQSGEAVGKVEAPGPVGLDQIREILFGALFRELERRLVRSDLHLSARSKEIEQEARRRTEVLETHLRTAIGALSARVEASLVEAADALHNVVRENREAISALEKRIAKAEEAGTVAQRELRNQLLEQAKAFLDELQRLRREMLATLQEELGLSDGEITEERREAEERARH